MELVAVYSIVHRYVAGAVFVLVGLAAVLAVNDGLPDDGEKSVLILGGWGLAGLSSLVVLAASPRLRVQAVLWTLALISTAVAFGGTDSSSLTRMCTVAAGICVFPMALVVALLQADDSAATPRSRF